MPLVPAPGPQEAAAHSRVSAAALASRHSKLIAAKKNWCGPATLDAGCSGRGARAGHGAQWLGSGGGGFPPGAGAGGLARLAWNETDGKAARKCVAARRRKAGRPFSEMA